MSPPLTAAAIDSALSSQSSGIVALHLRHDEEHVDRRWGVGEHESARKARLGGIGRFGGERVSCRRGRRRVLGKVVDVVDDLAQLRDESKLLLGRQSKPRQSRNSPYFF